MNKPLLILTLSASALSLTGCADLMHPKTSITPATLTEEPPKPVQIVEVPKVLPLPGQLQPDSAKKSPELSSAARDARPPTARVDEANKAATQEPTRYGYINAVQVYPFTEGALYRLYATPERVSDIMLQQGEKLTSVSAGDTVRWIVGDTQSGSGDAQQVHVLVKPLAPDLKTNLVITTDRRAYHLQLESTAKTFMAGLSWSYPQDELTVLRRLNAEADAAQPVAMNVALKDINFHYELSGDRPSWRPVRAFDDGHKVYIEFPASIDQDKAPPLFIVGWEGDSDLVNYRMRGTYYIVDRLFSVAELRLGTSPQEVVRITKTENREEK